MKIELSKLNLRFSLARIRGGESFEKCDVSVRAGTGKSEIALACESAARKLRAMADRFDLLAHTPNAYNVEVQEKINAMPIAKVREKLQRKQEATK